MFVHVKNSFDARNIQPKTSVIQKRACAFYIESIGRHKEVSRAHDSLRTFQQAMPQKTLEFDLHNF